MLRWSTRHGEERHVPAIDAFLREVIGVCRRHGFSIGHEDTQGAFLVQKWDPKTADWLLAAADERKEDS
jgi:hypothetical protein